MNTRLLSVIMIIGLVLIGCNRSDKMPYKSLADTRLSTPTGNVVGAQKETVAVVNPEEKKVNSFTGPSCTDTDYGDFPTAAGKVKGFLADGTEFEESDKCFGDVLYEFNCYDASFTLITHNCKRGCKNGFCI